MRTVIKAMWRVGSLDGRVPTQIDPARPAGREPLRNPTPCTMAGRNASHGSVVVSSRCFVFRPG